MADEAKAKGNADFAAGKFPDAVKHFSDAINLAPTNHVLYSNRSAAYASLHNYSDALSDAKQTVKINGYWSKGYGRLGAAYLGLDQISDAISSYKKGLDLDPDNEALKSGLADAESAENRSWSVPSPSPFGDAFSGPEMWAKLTADPTTRAFLQQPDYVSMMKDIQNNPNNFNMYLKDQRVMQSFGVFLGVTLRSGNDDMEIPVAEERPVRKDEPEPESEPELEPEPMEIPEGEREKKERKGLAQKCIPSFSKMSRDAKLRKEVEDSGSASRSDVGTEPLSGKPFFDLILQKSHINGQLVIPARIARMLPSITVPAELTYGNKKWEMTICRHKRHTRLDYKWKTFVADNNLAVGDACVFELMENGSSMIKFKVQILWGDFPPELLKKQEGSKERPLVI